MDFIWGFVVGFFAPWVLASIGLVVAAVVKYLRDHRRRSCQDTGATRNDVRR